MVYRLCPEFPSKGPSLEGSALRGAGNSLWLQNKGGSLVALLGTGLWSPVAVDLLSLFSQHSVKLPGMMWRSGVVGYRGWRLSCWNIHICLSNQRGKSLQGCIVSSTGHRGSGNTRSTNKGLLKRWKCYLSKSKGSRLSFSYNWGAKSSASRTPISVFFLFSSFPISSLFFLPGNDLGKSLKSYNQLWYLTFM